MKCVCTFLHQRKHLLKCSSTYNQKDCDVEEVQIFCAWNHKRILKITLTILWALMAIGRDIDLLYPG